ncbi:MAG: diaminopimelate epimerase [Terriglobales bacterium]|jgi:diaminopimelate epimerase
MTSPSNDAPKNIIAFTKASACGNDFLIVEDVDPSQDLSALTRRLCDRHNGIGADGVEWLFPDSEADVRARLINADGSDAEISGNGTRCVAAQIYSRTTSKKEVIIRTGAGLKTCRLIRQQGPTFEFEIDMGQPEVGERLTIATTTLRAEGVQVSMGNPHYVIFVDSFPEGWQQQAAHIQAQPHFPQGTNVEYVVVRSPSEIEIRLFERGAGETQSSGTGSCASAVTAIASRRAVSPVTVIAPGGPQTVRWHTEAGRNHVYLQGPATLVCRGEFFV